MSGTLSGVRTVWDDVVNLVKTPFVGELDLAHLFMLVGIVLVFIVLWMIIFNNIIMVSQEV